MRCLWIMFVTAVCFLFLLKLKWPKNKNIYDDLTHNMMPFIKKVNGKPSCMSLSKWPPSCATPPSSPSSSYAPASNTASHDNHEKINSWVSFTFLWVWSSATNSLEDLFFTFSGEYFTDKPCCIALRCWLAHPSLFYSSHLKWNTFFIIITYITTVTVIAIIQKRTLLTKQHLHYNSYITYNTVLRQQ